MHPEHHGENDIVELRGVVEDVVFESGPVETTSGGTLGGPPPDLVRRFVPGPATITLRIRLLVDDTSALADLARWKGVEITPILEED